MTRLRCLKRYSGSITDSSANEGNVWKMKGELLKRSGWKTTATTQPHRNKKKIYIYRRIQPNPTYSLLANRSQQSMASIKSAEDGWKIDSIFHKQLALEWFLPSNRGTWFHLNNQPSSIFCAAPSVALKRLAFSFASSVQL